MFREEYGASKNTLGRHHTFVVEVGSRKMVGGPGPRGTSNNWGEQPWGGGKGLPSSFRSREIMGNEG